MSSSSLSSSSCSSTFSFGFPRTFLHGKLVRTTITKNPAMPYVAMEVKISRGWELPAFNLALVTEIHSLNFGRRKELSLQSSSLQKHVYTSMPPSSPPAHSSWHQGQSELQVLSGVRETQWRDMAVLSTPSSLNTILEEEQTPPSSQVSTPPAEFGPEWSEWHRNPDTRSV